MTIANDIINCRIPDFDAYVRAGETLDDIDEYGFTPLIECAITRQPHIAELLLEKKVNVNKPDVTGRTALHWAVDHNDIEMTQLLLSHGANPNAYTNAGLSTLVYPILRGQDTLKQLLYQQGAVLDFAVDFINGKSIGHRFELQGDVDIVNGEGEFIELDYEGFILEFTVAMIKDSLRRFVSSFSTKHLRMHFSHLHAIMNTLGHASELLQLQHHALTAKDMVRLEYLIEEPLLILPAASRGHAISFVRLHQWWAKIDRGENSLKEGSVNIYQIKRPQAFTVEFMREFLYKKQPRRFFHEEINHILGLEPVLKFPMSSQIAGNCSWANVQGAVPVAYSLLQLESGSSFSFSYNLAKELYNQWLEWDKDRTLYEAIQRLNSAGRLRRASYASMLGSILFQACDDSVNSDLARAEKIIKILTSPEYYYILESYINIYCVKRLTRKGNNLLKLLDDCGFNPQIGITPIATGLKPRKEK
jgi:hypothetical protein